MRLLNGLVLATLLIGGVAEAQVRPGVRLLLTAKRPAAAGNYEAEATALFARMTTQPNATRKGHINTMIVSLKNGATCSCSVWALLDGLWIMAAHEQDTAKLNWISTSNAITLTDAPTWAADQGYTTDGSNDSVDLNYNPASSALSQTNSATFFTKFHNNVQASASVTGNYNGTSGQSLNPRNTSDAINYRINQSSTTTVASQTDARGLLLVTRTGSSTTEGYRDGASLGAGSAGSSSEISANLRLGVVNGTFFPQRFSAAGAGAGFTDAQAFDLSTAINTYMTAIGN